MSSSDKLARPQLATGLRIFLCACIFCLAIHFLVNDMAIQSLNHSLKSVPGKTTSLRFTDNDHQEDDFSKLARMASGDVHGLTLPLFTQPVFASNRAISPLYLPPKA